MHGAANLLSLEWWLSVGAVAVLLHILATYGTRFLDRTFGSVSTRWKERQQKQSAAEREATLALVMDDQAMALTESAENRSRHRVTLFMVLVGWFATLIPWGSTSGVDNELRRAVYQLVTLIMFLTALIGMKTLHHANVLARRIRIARGIKQDIANDPDSPGSSSEPAPS